MLIKTLYQPFVGNSGLFDVLHAGLQSTSTTNFTAVTAWAKESAFSRLRPSLTNFRARGGTVQMIIGLSQGGATEEGLLASLELASTTHVVFDPTGRTFHPKVYILDGESTSTIVIGSQNLTAGGLFTNYEAGVALVGNRDNDPDFGPIYEETMDFVRTISQDEGTSRRLNPELLQRLILSREVEIGSENRSESTAQTRTNLLDRVFDRSSFPLRRAPKLPARPLDVPYASTAAGGRDESEWYPVESIQVPAAADEYWWKKLPAADALRLSTAHPTGHLALTKAGFDIQQGTYFRQTLFGSAEWVPSESSNGAREHTFVSFSIMGLGVQHRRALLRIDHTPQWDSDQGNRATSIRWGHLVPTLRRDINTTGLYLLISKLPHNNYTMTFSKTEPVLRQ